MENISSKMEKHRRLRSLHSRILKNKDIPPEIKLELTPECNLNCEFCYNNNSFAKQGRQNPELNPFTTEQIIQILDKLSEEKIPCIRFTGGEPMLRKDFPALLKYARKKGFYIKLNTNGTMINNDNLDIIEEYVDEILLPLHSCNENDEKKLTGNSLFQKKIEAINLLVKSSSESKTSLIVNTVATKENIQNLDKFFQLVKELKIKNWFLALPVPSENNKHPVTNSDIGLLIEKLIKYNRENSTNHYLAQAIPFCSYDPTKISSVARGAVTCGPNTNLTIDPLGNIRLCYSSQVILGNIFKNSINECWNSKQASSIRNLDPETIPKACTDCSYLWKCRAGCRFSAMLSGGELNSKDPLAKI